MELLIEDIIHWHEHLDPTLFENNTLKPDVREELLSLMEEAFPDVYHTFPDIIIAGSRCSYYYHEHSDLDIGFLAERPLPKIELNKPIMFRNLRVDYAVGPIDAFNHLCGVYSLKYNKWYENRKIDFPSKETIQEATRIYNRLVKEICNLDPKNVKQYMGLEEHEDFFVIKSKKPYKPELSLDEVVKEASDKMGFSRQMSQVKFRIYNECSYNIYHPLVLATKLIVKNGYCEKLTGIKFAGQI